MKEQITAIISENRPWVLLAREIVAPDLTDSWRFEARLENFGKTPAKITTLYYKAQLGDVHSPEDPGFFQAKCDFIPFVLAQGECIVLSFGPGTRRGEFFSGQKHLWLCGVVKYEDVFGSPQRTVYQTYFCLRCDNSGRKPTWIRDIEKFNFTS
jgi:hypothetical protein